MDVAVTNKAIIGNYKESEDIMDGFVAAHPFKGLGEPEDIAKAAVFLASEDASWMTGVLLPILGRTLVRP